MAGSNLICVDFSGDSLKIAFLQAISGKKQILNLKTADIHGLSDSDIARTLKSCLSGLSVRSLSAISIVQSPLAITRNIEVPSQNVQEIEEIVNLQASRLTPYAREDIIIDYINVGTYRKNYTKLLLITVTRSLIKRQIDILFGAGIKIERICFSADAIAYAVSQVVNAGQDEGVVNILHINSNFTDFIIALKGKLIFVRGIPIGAEQIISGKEQYHTRLIEEIKRSLEAYKVEDIEKSPQRLIFSGAIENLKELGSALNSTFRIPVTTLPYLKYVHLYQEALKAPLPFERQSFLDVIAPLIAADRLRLNLILEEIKLKRLLEEKGKDVVKTGMFIMICFILICAILVSKIYFRGLYLRQLNSMYAQQHNEAQRLEEDFTRVRAVRNYLFLRGGSLSVLDALYNVIPSDVQLADIRFERQGRFTVRGSAASMASVFALIDDMGKTAYFKDVKSKYATKRKEAGRDMVDFEIVSLVKYISTDDRR